MATRKRPEMYEKSIKPKRDKYVKEGKCIDCGMPTEKYRCNNCNAKNTAYMAVWRSENREKLNKYQKKQREANLERYSLNNLRYRAKQYGLTIEEFEARKHEKCGICGENKSKMVVDHCHKTGETRGVLCSRCNSQLGWYEKFAEEINGWIEHNGVK